MTAIVGLEHSGAVYLGGDRAISGDDSVVRSAHSKVWRRGGILLGVAGQLDQLQRMAYVFRVPPYRAGRDPARYLGRKLAPALVAFFSGGKDVEIQALAGVGGCLFYLDDGFSFSRVGPEWAIGSGGDAARAALKLLPGQIDPRERVRRSLEIASEVCLSVAPPFDVLSL